MKFTKALKYIILSLQLLIFGCECKNFDAIDKVIESFSSNANKDPNKKEIITSFNSSSTAPPPVAIVMQGNQKSPPPPRPPKSPCMDFQDDRINHGDLVVFVDAVNGKADNSGESWEKAVNSINLALGIVVTSRAGNLSKGNAIQEAFIAVAAGKYTHEHENKISSLGDGKEMIALYGYTDSILSNIIIAGGFLSGDKCSEVDKNDKYNPNERKTIIDAKSKSGILAIAEENITNIDIRDFTFINGAAKEVNAIVPKKDGGAISLRGKDLDNITFRNINIEDSTAENNGGAVAITGASISKVVFNGLSIKNSTAENNGGAIAITGIGIGNVVFNGLVIDESTANENGGGFYASSGDIELNSIKITNNKSKNGGGLYIMANASITVAGKDNFINENKISEIHGAGIYINSDKNHSFDKLTVFKNTSVDTANAANLLGAGVYLISAVSATPTVTFTNSTINDHKAQDGAGIYAVNTKIELDGVILKNNIATENGGGVYSLASIDIGAFTCEENNAKDGGCLYVNIINLPDLTNRQKNAVNMRVFNKNTASNFGGAIYALSAVRNLHDAAFIGNQSSNGGAIYANDNSMAVNIKNALFRKNNASSYGGAIYFAKNSQISTEIVEQDNKGNLESSLAKISLLDSPQRTNGTDAEGNTIPDTEESFPLFHKAIVSLFDNNTAKFAGGAIYANKDLSILNSSNNININKNYRKNSLIYYVVHNYDFPLTFDGNNSQYGGAIYATNFQQSGYGEYLNNIATFDGGAILAKNINNQLNGVYKNNSAKNGAAIFADNLRHNINILEAFNNAATNKGGALYFNNLTNNYTVDGKFTANKANIASVLYLDNSNSNKLTIAGTYTENTSSESPILVINNHINMSLEVAGSYSQNNLNCIECLKHSEIAEFVDDVKTVDIAGTYNNALLDPNNKMTAITRSTEGGAFKFVNVATLSISGRSNNYKTTENGGFLDVDKVTDLTLNNINYSSNKSHKNGGAISIQEIENQANIENIFGNNNEAGENGGYLYIEKVKNLNVSNVLDAKGSISYMFENLSLKSLGFPTLEAYENQQKLYNKSQAIYYKKELIKMLDPLLNSISNESSLQKHIIKLLKRGNYYDFASIKNAIVSEIVGIVRVNISNTLNADPKFANLDPIKQTEKIDKAVKLYSDKLKDSQKPMRNFIAVANKFMSNYENMKNYRNKALDNEPHNYYDDDLRHLPIEDNKAKNGGFIYVHNVENDANFIGLTLYGNNVSENGGAFYLNEVNKSLQIKECLFDKNKASKKGGALYANQVKNNILLDNTRTPLNKRTRYHIEYFDIQGYTSLSSPSLDAINSLINVSMTIKPNSLVSTILVTNNQATDGGFAYIGQIGTNLQIKNFVSANSSMVIDKLNGSVIQGVNNLILTTDAAKTSGVVINNKPALNINAVVIKP